MEGKKLGTLRRVTVAFAVFGSLVLIFKQNSKRPARCVIYDSPQRTGSSTIRGALEDCFAGKDHYFSFPKVENHQENRIQKTLNEEHENYVSVVGHIRISKADIKMIKNRCKKVFYITSAAPLLERMRSMLKYRQTAGHGNSTLSSDFLKTPLNESTLKFIRYKEEFYNAFPHNKQGLSEKDRLVPDYVIQKKTLMDDLGSILSSFGCDPSTFVSTNIHELDKKGTEVLDSQIKDQLKSNDFRFKKLIQIRKRRKTALKKAKNFA